MLMAGADVDKMLGLGQPSRDLAAIGNSFVNDVNRTPPYMKVLSFKTF
jgi:hypothetical protein